MHRFQLARLKVPFGILLMLIGVPGLFDDLSTWEEWICIVRSHMPSGPGSWSLFLLGLLLLVDRPLRAGWSLVALKWRRNHGIHLCPKILRHTTTTFIEGSTYKLSGGVAERHTAMARISNPSRQQARNIAARISFYAEGRETGICTVTGAWILQKGLPGKQVTYLQCEAINIASERSADLALWMWDEGTEDAYAVGGESVAYEAWKNPYLSLGAAHRVVIDIMGENLKQRFVIPFRRGTRGPLVIHSALYGLGPGRYRDVTENVRKLVKNDELDLRVHPDHLHCDDPYRDEHKHLRIEYSYGKQEKLSIQRSDLQTLHLPDDET